MWGREQQAGFPACVVSGARGLEHLVLGVTDEVFRLFDHQLVGLLGRAAEIGADEVMTPQFAVDVFADAPRDPILPPFSLRLRIDQKPFVRYGLDALALGRFAAATE